MENKKKEIEKFYKQIFSDEKLKERIREKAKKIVTEKDLRKLIREEIMPLMKKFKVNFSEEELLEYEEKSLKELSAEDLEGVSGGRGLAMKPLLGLGIMAFSMFGGIGLESFAAGGSGKGKTGKPGTSQTDSKKKGTSSRAAKDDDDDDYEEEEEKDIDPKKINININKKGMISFKYDNANMNKPTFFKFSNKFQENGDVYSPRDANDRSRALKCVLLNNNVMNLGNEALLSQVYNNMIELRKNENIWENLSQEIEDKVNNFLKEYEKSHDDDIDVNEQEMKDIGKKIQIEIDEDGISFKYDDRYISESKFFELAGVYQQDNSFSFSSKNPTPEKALKGILINENAMKEWEDKDKTELCDKVFVIIEKKIRSNANLWDKLSEEVKNKVIDFSNEYLNNKDISPEEVAINIDKNQRFNFKGFSLNGKIISTEALLKIAENYKQKNDEYIPDGDDITLSTAMKCILFNENVMENLKSKPGLFDKVYEIVELFVKNKQALNSLPPEVKDKLTKFLEEHGDYDEAPRISSKPQKWNPGKSKKSNKSRIVVNNDADDDDDNDDTETTKNPRKKTGKRKTTKKVIKVIKKRKSTRNKNQNVNNDDDSHTDDIDNDNDRRQVSSSTLNSTVHQNDNNNNNNDNNNDNNNNNNNNNDNSNNNQEATMFQNDNDTHETEENRRKLLYSGECGGNCRYEFYEDGTLVISGEGDIDTIKLSLACSNFCEELFKERNAGKSPSNKVSRNRIYVKSLHIGKGVTIPQNKFVSFFSCTRDPDNLRELDGFEYLERVTVDKDNPYYSSIDGALYSKDGKILVFVPTAWKGRFRVPPCTTSIGDRAFMNCINIKVIEVPANVKEIDKMAFWGCSAGQINFSDNSEIEALPEQTFAFCFYLKDINLPPNLKTIYGEAFRNCYALKSITIPPKVTKIDYWAFMGCDELKEVTIKGKPFISRRAFDGCKNLTVLS